MDRLTIKLLLCVYMIAEKRNDLAVLLPVSSKKTNRFGTWWGEDADMLVLRANAMHASTALTEKSKPCGKEDLASLIAS